MTIDELHALAKRLESARTISNFPAWIVVLKPSDVAAAEQAIEELIVARRAQEITAGTKLDTFSKDHTNELD